MLKIITISILLLVNGGSGGRFLLVPLPVTSHCLEMIGIANELMKRQHSVIAYVPENFKTSKCFANSNVTMITYEVSEEYKQLRKFSDEMLAEIVFNGHNPNINTTLIKISFHMGKVMCESALLAFDKLTLLKSLNIDIVLIDSAPLSHCMLYLPRYLNADHVIVGSVIFPSYTGGPSQSHTLPSFMSSFTNSMSLKERILNTILTIVGGQIIKVMTNLFESFDKNKLEGLYPAEILKEDTSRLTKHSLLFLENHMNVLDYPKAVYPNFIRVGGLTTGPAKPLPKDLELFFSKAKKGVIVVSFGSMLEKAPDLLLKRIVNIFKNFEQHVVMSYHKNDLIQNVKTVSWLPQNDVLGHKNTVLFVSHCGKNGLNEGFYHAVPILCTPFHTDQWSNALKVKEHKIGDVIDLINSKDEEIIEKIRKILYNKEFRQEMKRLAAIFHDDPFTPQEKSANALEHVLKFGGDHLRPVSSDFNVISEYMIDIWLIIFLGCLLFIYISYKIITCILRCICSSKTKSQQKKKHE